MILFSKMLWMAERRIIVFKSVNVGSNSAGPNTLWAELSKGRTVQGPNLPSTDRIVEGPNSPGPNIPVTVVLMCVCVCVFIIDYTLKQTFLRK